MGCQHTISYSDPEEHRIPIDSTIRPTAEPRYHIEVSDVPDQNMWSGTLEVVLRSTTPSIKDVRIEMQRKRRFNSWSPGNAIIGRALSLPFAMLGRLLFIASKVVKDGNVDKVKYSIQDARTPAMLNFLNYLDMLRSKVGAKVENSNYLQSNGI